jgi:hypothetical protein
MQNFLIRNNEKPTNALCLLGREHSTCDDISQIRGEGGVEFQNSKERGEHIRAFYSGLYKKKLDVLLKIEDFLSRETVEQEWVQNRKLSDAEKENLEGAISIEELSIALKNSNLKSSSGWDGVSYKMLKKYWAHLSKLSMQMANECFERGELTETFKLGLIKLIPKKGNAQKVDEWRPITLLSCGYKLISGVVAARLEKYMYKIIGREQKGFLRSKNIGTVIMNVIDGIEASWANKEQMGVLCVDFVKAFDSVEYRFIQNVLEFFNFGGR